VKNRKIDAALHNFHELVKAGGPRQFFQTVASMDTKEERIKFLSKTLAFYKKKDAETFLSICGSSPIALPWTADATESWNVCGHKFRVLSTSITKRSKGN
jgi:hypothetical protein